MKSPLLSILFFCIGSVLGTAGDLKPEAIALLKTAIENSKGVPESMTPDKLYQVISEEVDFALSDTDLEALNESKPLRDPKEFIQCVTTSNALENQRFPISVEQICKSIKSASTDARTREAGFRLLSHFNRMKTKSLTTQNISRAKQLCLAILSGDRVKAISEIDGQENLRFQHIVGEEDWIYSPTDFGDLGDAAPHGGKVILMAPRTIDGALVMGCDNGSVYALPLDKVRDRIDVSKIKQEAEQDAP